LILVVIESGDAERLSEGLRAALGLGLRGEPVAVVLTGAAAAFAPSGERGDGDPRIARALRTLRELGRPAEVVAEAELPARMRAARAVEVWTSGSRSPARPRRMQLGGARELEIWPEPPRFRQPEPGGGPRPVDGGDLVAQILGSDGPVVLW